MKREISSPKSIRWQFSVCSNTQTTHQTRQRQPSRRPCDRPSASNTSHRFLPRGHSVGLGLMRHKRSDLHGRSWQNVSRVRRSGLWRTRNTVYLNRPFSGLTGSSPCFTPVLLKGKLLSENNRYFKVSSEVRNEGGVLCVYDRCRSVAGSGGSPEWYGLTRGKRIFVSE